jgi:hypothetical protein
MMMTLKLIKMERNLLRIIYANIYKVTEETDMDSEGCVGQFLGSEIVKRPNVINSKISPEQNIARTLVA